MKKPIKELEKIPTPTFQDRGANFRDDDGNLFLVRCYSCDEIRGTENYALCVARGQCAWCGWKEEPPLEENLDTLLEL